MLLAAPEDYEGKRIAAISFQPPEQTLTPAELDLILPVRVGEPLRLTEVTAAIERLFATGRYDDIEVNADMRPDGVALRFTTTPNWFIGRVTVDNVPEPPNEGQLVNATKLSLGTEYTDGSISQAMENLLEVLRNNGFYQAKVQPDLEHRPDIDQVSVHFLVEPGERARFSQPVIKGNPERPVETIVAATRWKRLFGLLGWHAVTDRRVESGLDRIRNYYQKRDYLMSKVVLESMEYKPAENRVTPTIFVDAGDKIVVRTTGAKVSRGKLRQLVPVYQEQAVDRDLLVEGRRNLTEYLQAEGYFDARVEFETQKTDNDSAMIVFDIARGERYKLVHLEVGGNQYFDDETITERMFVTPATLLRFRHGRFSADLLERDVEAITDLYRSNGFADVQVTSKVERSYKNQEQDVAVFIEIEEGPQWFVSGLELSGVDPKIYEYIQSLLQSMEGQPYSEFNVATDRDTILNYYFNNGFPDATFESTASPGPRPQTITLKFTVNEGRRQFVRDVVIGGLEATQPDLVLERITLAQGDPLSQSEMIESQRRLYDLSIFAKVGTAIQNPEGLERNKYVLYQFEEASKYSITAGVGAQIARIGGAQGLATPAGAIGFSPRVSLGVSRSNFLGLGHTFGLQTRLSNIQRRAVLTYLAPQFRGNEDVNLTLTGLYDDSRDVRTFSSRRFEGSAQVGQRLTRANTMQYRVTYRQVRVRDFELITTPQLIPLLQQPVRLGIVGGTFIQDRRDDPILSTKGIYNTIDVGLASKYFGSQADFTRTLWRNSTYHRIGREYVLARALTFGWLHNLGPDNTPRDVPVPERFFAGGSATHRGFPDNQAGPRDLITGFPIGGKALLMNNIELRFPLLGDHIGGVLFHDAGNVYTNLRNISFRFKQRSLTEFDYMAQAVGFGVRYRTPVGPIRVDLAYAPNSTRFRGYEGTFEELIRGVDLPSDPRRISRLQFHFSIGQTF